MKAQYRERFTFWLDLNKPQEYEIAETVFQLKQQRSFAQTIRDGIRLITSLRAGKLEVLFELFPWIQHSILAMQPIQIQQPHQRFEELIQESAELPSLFATAEPVDPSESRATFASGFGNLFNDDDEDLWD